MVIREGLADAGVQACTDNTHIHTCHPPTLEDSQLLRLFGSSI